MIGGGGKHGVGLSTRQLDHLEITDAYAEPIRRQVRAQLGSRCRTDLDAEYRCSSGKQILRRLARTRTNLHDLRSGREQCEQLVEELGGIRGPDPVVDVSDLIERESDVTRLCHVHILPEMNMTADPTPQVSPGRDRGSVRDGSYP